MMAVPAKKQSCGVFGTGTVLFMILSVPIKTKKAILKINFLLAGLEQFCKI